MGTNNFLKHDKLNKYYVFNQEDYEDLDEARFHLDMAKADIVQALQEMKIKKFNQVEVEFYNDIENQEWDSANGSYQGKIFASFVIRCKYRYGGEYHKQIDIISRNGYYSDVNFDIDIEDNISDDLYDLGDRTLAFAKQKAESIEEYILPKIEKAFTKYSESYFCRGIASSGDAYYIKL